MPDRPKKFAFITWTDAFHDDKFVKATVLNEEEEDYIIHSIGWLIRETPKIITIAMDFEGTEGGSYREVRRIRKENIIEMQIINEAS